MTTISLCMIVKNEAVALPRSLAAARPWVDEIIVVDTGSTDATADIARRHGARVFTWEWRDDFAAARNESLRHATGDWILVLDADEELTEGSGEALRRACEHAARDVAAFEIKIICPRAGDGGLVRLNWFPRLFRNLPGVRFDGVIHEQVIESLVSHGRIERSTVAAMHSGYTLSPEEMAAKSARNLKLLERQVYDDPTYAPGWFQLAETYVLANRLDDAVGAYRRCLRLLDSSRLTLGTGIIAVALQNLGAALIARGDRELGVNTIKAALAVEPSLIPARVHLGMAALCDRRPAEAAEHFVEALALVESMNDGEYTAAPWLLHFLHGCALARQDKLTDALTSFRAALAAEPRHTESLWLLALTSGNSGDWDSCLDAVDRLAQLGRDDFALHAQRATALAALGRHDDALAAAERALGFEPASAPMLALAGEALARGGRPGEATAFYERLADAVPQSVAPLLALAQCYENAGDEAAMMRTYERAVALAPDSAEVLFALGSACLRAGALPAAEECLAGAVDRAPERADYHLNHALCLLKSGAIGPAAARLRDMLGRWPGLAHARELLEVADRLAGQMAVADSLRVGD